MERPICKRVARTCHNGPRVRNRSRGGRGGVLNTADVRDALKEQHGVNVSVRTVRRDLGPICGVRRNMRKAAAERARIAMLRDAWKTAGFS